MDERIKTLAHNLVNYSCGVKEGDKVYVHYIGNDTEPLARSRVIMAPSSRAPRM